MERQQGAIEAGDFVGLGDRLDVAAVENGSGPHDGLGGVIVGNVSDEFH